MLQDLLEQTAPARRHKSGSEIEEFAVPLPPLAEQHRIVAEVERRLSVIEELEAVVAANLQRATRLRQSILHRAFRSYLMNASLNSQTLEFKCIRLRRAGPLPETHDSTVVRGSR